jgi:hypothetical protein
LRTVLTLFKQLFFKKNLSVPVTTGAVHPF